VEKPTASASPLAHCMGERRFVLLAVNRSRQVARTRQAVGKDGEKTQEKDSAGGILSREPPLPDLSTATRRLIPGILKCDAVLSGASVARLVRSQLAAFLVLPPLFPAFH